LESHSSGRSQEKASVYRIRSLSQYSLPVLVPREFSGGFAQGGEMKHSFATAAIPLQIQG
jgi:hypothetical protein